MVETVRNNLFRLFLSLIFIVPIFCNDDSLSNDEIIELFHSVEELEFKDSLNVEIINNLELQLKDYKNLYNNTQLQIEDYKTLIILKDDMIKLVKPKWYDNKYLWFFGGIFLTAGAVHLAGQID